MSFAGGVNAGLLEKSYALSKMMYECVKQKSSDAQFTHMGVINDGAYILVKDHGQPNYSK